MNTDTLEYAFFQENFEIFQFKFKTYGCGKWAKTYDEAHELAKEAVLKKCMEENPHLAFQNKPEMKFHNIPVDNGKMGVFMPSVVVNEKDTVTTYPNGDWSATLNKSIPLGKINPEKKSIEEQIQACTEIELPFGLKSFEIIASMNPKLKQVYDHKMSLLETVEIFKKA